MNPDLWLPDGDLDAAQRETLVRLTERYCVVWQTLRQPPAGSVTLTTTG